MEELFSLGCLVFIIVGMLLFSSVSHYSKKICSFPEVIWMLLFGITYGLFQRYTPAWYFPELKIEPSLILHLFVPILIFAASQKICLTCLRRVIFTTNILATVWVLISMFAIAFFLNLFFHIPLLPALLFWIIISATDPLAVGAILSGNKDIPESKKLLIEWESILNDGFVVTVFGILSLILFEGHEFQLLVSSYEFILHIGIALAVGVGLARSIRFLLKKWHEEHFTLSINMTILLAFASFALTEALGGSWIIAVFVAALAYGYKPDMDGHNKEIHEDMWEYIEYLANGILFFLLWAAFISQSDISFFTFWFILAGLVILAFARAIALWVLLPFLRIDWNKFTKFDFYLLHLAGSRGAVSIALILLLPDTFEYKGFFLSLAFIIIIMSLVINPLLLQKLIKK